MSEYVVNQRWRQLRISQIVYMITTKFRVPSSLYVLPDPGNMGVVVGISLLSCVSAEICATEFTKPPSWISDFRLPTCSLVSLL